MPNSHRGTDPGMKQDWEQIVSYFGAARLRSVSDDLKAALGGIEEVAKSISQNAMRQGLFGWTSMLDLCVQQTDIQPYSGPYLRVSPLASGMIEFRYLDTAVENRQWHRTEVPTQAVWRLEAFFDQLGWRPKPA